MGWILDNVLLQLEKTKHMISKSFLWIEEFTFQKEKIQTSLFCFLLSPTIKKKNSIKGIYKISTNSNIQSCIKKSKQKCLIMTL